MSFFKDFKEDLSQAVNELMPEESAGKAQEDIQMVDTLTVDTLTDDEDENEPSIEEMLNNIENINLAGDSIEPIIEPMESIESLEQTESVEEESVIEEEPVMEFAAEPTMEEAEPVMEMAEPAAEITEPTMETAEPEIIVEKTEEIVQEEPMIEQEVTQVMEEQEVLVDEDRATDETGLITAGMVIKGDIITTGSLEVLGSVEGDIDVKGKLEVAGTIKGNSKAADVYAESAKITGEIVSSGPVKIGQNSVVKGNITAAAGVFAGAVKGDIDIQGPVILDTTAIIMGNIKSKSIQINNGAVVEGMCSQCYAEVSPANFFGEDAKPAAKAKK